MATRPSHAVARRCTSCGATVEFEAAIISTACSYCGSNLIDTPRAGPMIDRIAPFRLPRRAAEDRLRTHLARRWWAPESFRQGVRHGLVRAHELRGVLVPFCAYRATARGSYRARIGVHWQRTQTEMREGKRQTTAITETEWFDLRGTVVDELEDFLVPASVGLSAFETHALQPFDLGRAVRFDPRLLAGWEAEIPSRTRVEIEGSARQSMADREAERVHATLLPGDSRELTHLECEIEIHRVDLVLLPVWLASYSFGGSVYRLLVNGQTGRCVGTAPVSPHKVSAAAALVAAMIVLFLWATGVWS